MNLREKMESGFEKIAADNEKAAEDVVIKNLEKNAEGLGGLEGIYNKLKDAYYANPQISNALTYGAPAALGGAGLGYLLGGDAKSSLLGGLGGGAAGAAAGYGYGPEMSQMLYSKLLDLTPEQKSKSHDLTAKLTRQMQGLDI